MWNVGGMEVITVQFNFNLIQSDDGPVSSQNGKNLKLYIFNCVNFNYIQGLSFCFLYLYFIICYSYIMDKFVFVGRQYWI